MRIGAGIGAVLLAGVGGALAVGCGSSGGSSGGDSAEFAKQYCALYQPCCASAGYPAGDQAGCRSFFGGLPVTDAAAAQQCLDDLTAESSDPGFCHFETPQPASCAKAYPQTSQHGTKKPGQACDTTSDCAPQTNGDVTCLPGSASSICQVAVHAQVGQACQGTVDGNLTMITGDSSGTAVPYCYRSEGVFCAGDATCQALLDVGGACADYGACKDGAWCDSGTCAPRVAVGGACTGTEACVDGAYCDNFPSGSCAPKLAEGAACDSNEQCVTSYCDSTAMTCGQSHLGDLGLLLVCQ